MSVPLQSKELLTLDRAVSLAQTNDPWITSNQYQQSAYESMGVAQGSLPDPKVAVAMANVPVDSLDLNQEPMTQLVVGVTQMLPRGEQRHWQQQKMQTMAEQMPYLRQDRHARVKVMVSELWLEAYKAHQSIVLIEQKQNLFEQLVDVSQTSYSTTVGRTRQQDVIRAQLELTRLQDRLTQLHQQEETQLDQLREWLITPNSEVGVMQTSQHLPTIKQWVPDALLHADTNGAEVLAQWFSRHPALLATNKKIDAQQAEVQLAKQNYQPEWGLSASYGHRDDDIMGNERSDFFSVGITLDVPLFASNKQDKSYQSAVSKTEMVRVEKWQQLRQMMSQFEATRRQWLRLRERDGLYQTQLLPQMHEQAEASLTAYTTDDGDFTEVMRARIAELNGEIDALNIAVNTQIAQAKLNYFFEPIAQGQQP